MIIPDSQSSHPPCTLACSRTDKKCKQGGDLTIEFGISAANLSVIFLVFPNFCFFKTSLNF